LLAIIPYRRLFNSVRRLWSGPGGTTKA
jgi:hypothetical protein